jgi:hypothetical protein
MQAIIWRIEELMPAVTLIGVREEKRKEGRKEANVASPRI